MLDDDEDMAELYLTDKLLQQLENDSATPVNEQDDVDEQVIQSEMDDKLASSMIHYLSHCFSNFRLIWEFSL